MAYALIENLLPERTVAGKNALEALPEILKGKQALLITDETLAEGPLLRRIQALVPEADMYVSSAREPSDLDAQRFLDALDDGQTQAVVAIGGGSVLDIAKSAVALYKTGRTVASALGERVDWDAALPLIAVPTTAGTGSEATLNAILTDHTDGVKRAIIGKACLPQTALLDPSTMETLPAAIMASTAVDALCHCVESMISLNENAISVLYSTQGAQLILRHLTGAIEQPSDAVACLELLTASYCGGAALTLAGTAAVHALAYPLGKRGIPHGVANSALLAPVLWDCVAECGAKLSRLTIAPTAEETLTRIEAFLSTLPLPQLDGYGLERTMLPELASEAMQQTRLLSNHPKQLGEEQILALYEQLFAQHGL